MKLNLNLELVLLVLALIPPVVKATSYIGLRSTNRKIRIMSERALIIAKAMEETKLPGELKKEKALVQLTEFAAEVAIKLTPDQADQYIEYAVNELRQIGVKHLD